MPERGTRVDLTKTKNTEPKKPVSPKNEQAVPEGVKKVGDFGVLREDIVYIAPKPLFSARGKGKTW